MTLTTGSIFENKYEILETLGEGGMGVVYRAQQRESNRVIALKILHAILISDEEHVKRFRREARAISRLGHNNIVTFYHLGFTSDGVPYAAMEYLPGKNLGAILNEEDHLSPERCLHVMKQVCQGISHAHDAGIMHRDLKPANIILIDMPEPDFVKVVDFGLAKLTETSGLSTEKLTETGLLIGSFNYMSPEQVRGKPVDARSDIYACGCVMYESLTGQKPFDADNPVGVLHKHCFEPPAPFSQTPFGKLCPEKLEWICRKAMAKKPDNRYQTMIEFIKDLEVMETGKGNLLAGPVLETEEDKAPSPGKPRTKPSKQKARALLVAAASFLLLGVICGITKFQPPSKEQIVRTVLEARRSNVTPWVEQKPAQTGKKVRCTVMRQDNPHTGVWEVYLAENGMLSTNRLMSTTMVTAAPNWDVIMYNDKTKVYFQAPLTDWKGAQGSLKNSLKARKALTQQHAHLIDNPPKKIGDEIICGHRASIYRTDNLVTTGLKKVEFSVCDDIEVPAQLRQVFGKIYGVGLSKMKGIPLKIAYIDENGTRSPVFTTISVTNKEIPMNYFMCPPNYQRVENEIAVLMDEKGREKMDSIMNDLSKAENGKGAGELDDLLEEKKESRRESNGESRKTLRKPSGPKRGFEKEREKEEE